MQFSLGLQLNVEPDNGDAHCLPSLLFNLLDQVDRHRNLTVAAKNAGVSYRKAWNLMHESAELFGTALLDTTQGRGAKLTKFGAQLLWAREYMDSQGAVNLQRTSDHIQSALLSVLAETVSSSVAVSASHCSCLNILENLYQGATSQSLAIRFVGSQSSLSDLASGDCLIAGFHVAEGALSSVFLRRYAEVMTLSEIAAVQSHCRQQGLIVAPGNPLALQTIADITKLGATMVNRQPGSGTRILFDALAEQSGVVAANVEGYLHEEQTHSAVCARIANRQVDVALGTQSAAAQFGLGFIPLINETYYFSYRRGAEKTAPIAALTRLLGSDAWAQAIDHIAGLSAEGAGCVIGDVASLSRTAKS